MAVTSKVCAHCGRTHPTPEMVKTVNGWVCQQCLPDRYERCPVCGDWIAKGALTQVERPDGDPVAMCAKCNGKLRSCVICGYRHPPEEMQPITGPGTGSSSGTRFICGDCEHLSVVSVVSKARYLRKATEARIAEDGFKVFATTREWGTIPARSRASVDEPSIVPPRTRIAASRHRGQCPVCGQGYYHEGTAFILMSPHREALSEVCARCYDRYDIADCGHHIDRAELRGPVPLLASSAGRPDVDGATHQLFEEMRGRAVEYCDVTGSPVMPPAGGPPRPSDRVLCGSCIGRAMAWQRERGSDAMVMPYSFTPSPMFRYRASEGDVTPFMGFELEVAGPVNPATLRKAASEVYASVGRRHVYLKLDSSIGTGFEQVTYPATMEYYLSERARYENLLHVPKKHGLRSHDAGTCGLHVHVDRGYFPVPERNIDIRKVLYLSEKFFPEMFVFSRRDPKSATLWAKRWLDPVVGATMSAEMAATAFEEAMGDGDRRKAVNLQRGPTMEFRLFRGTLNPVTFWATLQLVSNVVMLAKATTQADLDRITWMDIIRYRDYPELREYNAQRIGEGWSGRVQVTARLVDDSGPRADDEPVEVPQVVAKDRVRQFQGYYYKASEKALVALWPKIKASAERNVQCFVSGRRLGENYVMEGLPEVRVEPRDSALVRVDLPEGERPLQWIVLAEGLIGTLPTEVQEVIIPAADRTLKCVQVI